MFKSLMLLCLLAMVLLCIGCNEQAKTDLPACPRSFTTARSQTPDYFFDQYPENWEHALYHREIAARYEEKRLAQR